MIINEKTLKMGVTHLTQADTDLAKVVEAYGFPPLWSREPVFTTLVQIILEQQVSLTSAKAAYNRLKEAIEPLTPGHLSSFSLEEIRALGLTRQKARYCLELAKVIQDGSLKLAELKTMDDETVRGKLVAVKGIGPWTANIFLLMALGRPDIWPVGDVALATAVGEIKGLTERPDWETFTRIAEAWRPWRSVAARICWHYYLSR